VAGNLVVGQAGGATAVINASLAGVVEQAQRSGRFSTVWGMRRGAEGALAGDYIDLSRVAPAQLPAVAATPGAILGSSRHKLDDEEAESVLADLIRRDVRAFLYIGGNDSADTVHRLAQLAAARGYDLSAIAVPKTIDNDIPETDHCPGYGSIARYVANATLDSAQDTESMPTMYPVKFIEVMGRDAGWVAASAGLAAPDPTSPPHLIYMPEFPLSRQDVLADVERVYREHGYVVAVVAETVRDETGAPFADPGVSAEVDAFGHPLLRGTADTLVRLVQAELGLRARFDKPGSLQRMSSRFVSPIDRAEAEEVGRAAVRLALNEMTDCMVSIIRATDEPYTSATSYVPLANVANRQRLVPEEYVTADRRGVSEAFRRFALPLLGAGALPHYVHLRDLVPA